MASNPSGQVLARMAKMTAQFAEADKAAVRRAALAAKIVQLDELDKVTQGRKLRNVGKSGAKVGVRYDVKGEHNPTALVRATGPWHFIENPSKAHEIKPKKRGKKKATRTPYGPRTIVQHPGVKNPKKPWAKGKPKAGDAARRAMNARYVEAFRRGAK